MGYLISRYEYCQYCKLPKPSVSLWPWILSNVASNINCNRNQTFYLIINNSGEHQSGRVMTFSAPQKVGGS